MIFDCNTKIEVLYRDIRVSLIDSVLDAGFIYQNWKRQIDHYGFLMNLKDDMIEETGNNILKLNV